MTFDSLTIENFQTFTERQTLPLRDQGLIYVTGINNVSTACSNNGVGKSAIFNSIAWCLTGKTLDGRIGDRVAHRFNDERCLVSLTFGDWTVERTRRPHAVTLSNTNGDVFESDRAEDKIESVLGFGYSTLRHAVVFTGADFSRFATASTQDQMRVLDEILQVDFSDELNKVKLWKNRIDIETGRIVVRIATLEEDRVRLLAEMERAKKAEEIWALDRQHRKADAEETRRQAEEQHGLQAKLVENAKAAEKLVQKIEAHLAEVDELGVVLVAATHAWELAERDVAEAERRLVSIKDVAECPTCMRSLGTDKRNVQALLAALLSDAARVFVATENAKTKADHALSAKRLEHAEWTAERLWRVKRMAAEIDELVGRAKVAKETLDHATNVAKQIAAERFPGAPMAGATRKALAKCRSEIKRLSDRRGKGERLVRLGAYLVEAFGDRGVRNLLFDSVEGYLTERIFEHLSDLAAGEVSGSLQAIAAGRRGGIKFDLSWDWGTADLSGASTGQDRRQQLAVYAAVQDLAEYKSARPFPIKVYDEPSDGLDGRGKELLADWLAKQAGRRGTTFVVSHEEEFAARIKPDHVWTVILDKGGARVEID